MKRIFIILAMGAMAGCAKQNTADTSLSMPAPPAPATTTYMAPESTTATTASTLDSTPDSTPDSTMTAQPLPPMVSSSTETAGRPVRTDTPAPTQIDPDSAARISVTELQTKMQQGNVVVLDVRNRVAFEMDHAKGAVNIPLEELETRAGELPRDKYIAAYCT